MGRGRPDRKTAGVDAGRRQFTVAVARLLRSLGSAAALRLQRVERRHNRRLHGGGARIRPEIRMGLAPRP